MQLYLPEQAVLCDQWAGASTWMGNPGAYSIDYYTGAYCRNAQPIMGKGEFINLPSLFKQTKGRKDNDVCHLKPDAGSSDLATLATSSGVPILPTGVASNRITYYGSSSTIGWLHTRRYSVWIENDKLTDIDWGYGSGSIKIFVVTAYWNGDSLVHKCASCEFFYSGSSRSSFNCTRISNNDFVAALPDEYREYLIGTSPGSLLHTYRNNGRFYWYGFGERMVQYVFNRLLKVDLGYHIWLKCPFSDASPIFGKPYKVHNVPSELPPDLFLFNEYERFDGTSLLLLGGGVSNNEYWRQRLMQHAFLDACDKLPKLNDNSISNVKDLCSFIYSLVVKHKIEIPKNWQSWWLSYRYVYKTTELDVKEAVSYVNRHISDEMWKTGISSYGLSTEQVCDVDVTCRVRIRVRSNDVDRIHKIWKKLVETGLSPDLYVMWDMLPYSFIVDWFIPVGDMLAAEDARYVYIESGWYNYESIVYSLSYDIHQNGNKYHAYTRWVEASPPKLSGYYWFGNKSTSDKTIIMRIIDSAALLIK